jgi:hypothetical protein
MVRLLAAVYKPFDGQALTRLFDETLRQDTDKMETEHALALGDLRWAIANTIACARPLGVANWLRKTIRDPRLGQSKEMLLIAAARILDGREAADLILPYFDEFPAQSAMALGECGGYGELQFLEEKLGCVKGEPKKAVHRAIRQIRKRLSD